MQVLTIGIAGGSGSGKTTIAQKIIDRVGTDRITHLSMDAYYRDLSHLPFEQRVQENFDHPSAYDRELFLQHITKLKAGVDIDGPEYDFVQYTRKPTTVRLSARPVIFLEGILLYENQAIADAIDTKIFVDTPSDLRFIRRMQRDIVERGRTVESVVAQYHQTVRPMHQAFVEPSRERADVIIPWQGYNEVAVDMVISRIESSLAQRLAGAA